MAATSQTDLCQAKRFPLLGNKTDEGATRFKEYCIQSKSSTAMLCPKRLLKGTNKYNQKVNKYFAKKFG